MFHDEFGRTLSVVPQHARCFAEEDPPEGGGAGDDQGDKDWSAIAAENARESKKYRLRAQQVEAKLEELKARAVSQEDLDELTRLREAEAERTEAEEKAELERQAKAGEFDAILKAEQDKAAKTFAQKDKKHAEALAAIEAEKTSLTTALQRATAEAQLVAALAKQGCEDPQEAAFLVFNRHEFAPRAVVGEDHNVKIQVVDRAGNEVIDPEGEGEAMTVEACAVHFLGTPIGQRFLPPSGDTGTGAHRGGPGQPDMAAVLSDPDKKAEYLAKHGGPKYVKDSLAYVERQNKKK